MARDHGRNRPRQQSLPSVAGGAVSPGNQQQGARRIIATRTEISAFSGPLPPAEELAKYEHNVYQGCAREIVEMAKTQMQHRHALEDAKLKGDLLAERIGQCFAFTITLVAIICGTYLIATGRSTAGLVAMLAPVAALAGIFFIARRAQARERQQKIKALEEIAMSQKAVLKADQGSR